MNDVASPIEQKNKQVPSEIEIPLDFDIDKSPPVNSAFGMSSNLKSLGTYLDKVRETEELNESVDDLESKNKINVSFTPFKFRISGEPLTTVFSNSIKYSKFSLSTSKLK